MLSICNLYLLGVGRCDFSAEELMRACSVIRLGLDVSGALDWDGHEVCEIVKSGAWVWI